MVGALISHKNGPITELLLDKMGAFNLNFDFSRQVAEWVLSLTDETDQDASPLWRVYGIETASYIVFLTQQLVILVPLILISCVLILPSYFVKQVAILKWLGEFLFKFFTLTVVFNLPLRFLMEVMLDSLISATAQIHDKATDRQLDSRWTGVAVASTFVGIAVIMFVVLTIFIICRRGDKPPKTI